MTEELIKTREKMICYHCGDRCDSHVISFEEKDFCCQGCKTVFQILDENGLCNYYDLDESAGISLKSKDFGDKYSYLDNEQIVNQLLEFKNEKFQKVTLSIPSIHCSSCIWLLENLHKIQEEINSSRVNFSKKEVSLIYNSDGISLRKIVELLSTLGYEPQITLKSKDQAAPNKSNTVVIKLGVAGFCFGNIMLLSFPEYFGIESASDETFIFLFNWLNLLLVLPVIFYSGLDYITSAFKSIRQKYLNIDVPITLGIFALFAQSLYEIITKTGAGYLDSLSGLIFFLLIGKWFQSKTYENLAFDRDYKSYFPLGIIKLVNNERVPIPIKDAQKGDQLLIRNKELIPVDCLLISENADIDYSFVTGEAALEKKRSGDTLYAGGKQIGGSIIVLVEEEVSQSKLVKLWNQDAFQQNEGVSFQFVDTISRYFTPAVLMIATVSSIYWMFAGSDLAVKVFASVLIVACPCALALASPFTYGSVLRVLGRSSMYLKNASVVEKIMPLQHIVFDKTGTLTNKENTSIRFTGELTEKEKAMVWSCLGNSTHILSVKIYDYLSQSQLDRVELDQFEEKEGKGIQGKVCGHELKIGSASFLNIDTSEQLNTIGIKVYVGINGRLKGYFTIDQQFRSNLKDVISKLSEKYSLSLLSGDNDDQKKSWEELFPTQTELLFNQSPEDKLNYIQSLQNAGTSVMMVGDGLNDAGALKQANVGIAITDDIATFTPSSDGILAGSNFNHLPELLKFANESKKVVVGAFGISFLYNLIGLSLAVTGNLEPVYAAILMPLSSITVVGFTTIAVNLIGRKI